MDIQAEKLEPIGWPVDINEPSIIKRFIALKKKQQPDWWDGINADEKSEIEQGLTQADNGEVVPRQEVMAKYQKWRSKSPWTPRAITGYDRIINDLIENRAEWEIVNFINETDSFFEILKEHPEVLEKTSKPKNVYSWSYKQADHTNLSYQAWTKAN